jgi:hypothetical protein
MTQPAVNPARFGPRQAQPLEGLAADARDVLAGLFAKADPADLPPLARAAIEANERIRGIAARKFGDAEGRELLEALCDATLRRPTFVTQLGIDPMQALVFGAFREGQAATVFLLLAWIAEGRGEQQPTRERGSS